MLTQQKTLSNMEKEFVPYELAVKLKAIGFDEPCFGYYFNENEVLVIGYEKDITLLAGTSNTTFIIAPTFSQAFRWFREQYGLESYIRANLVVNVPKTYQFNIDDKIDDNWYDTYEEAELYCLDRLIDKITNKKIFDFVTDL